MRSNGIWYYQAVDPDTGKVVQQSLKTTDKKVADLKARAKDAEGVKTVSRETLSSIFERYQKSASTRHAANTIKSKQQAVAAWKTRVGEDRLSSIKPDHVHRLVLKMRDDGYEPSTINLYLCKLAAIVNQAINEGVYTGKNPFTYKALPVTKEDARFIESREDIEKLLATAERHSNEMLICATLGVFAGLRAAEIANARWEWFDWDRKVLRVQSGHGWEVKDRESRTIPLHADCIATLLPLRGKSGYCISPDVPPTTDPKKPRVRWYHRFETVTKHAGMPWVTPHTLRHTFASHLVIKNVEIAKVAKWLGHSDIKLTYNTYSHLRAEDDDINRI
jgi:integrase